MRDETFFFWKSDSCTIICIVRHGECTSATTSVGTISAAPGTADLSRSELNPDHLVSQAFDCKHDYTLGRQPRPVRQL